MSFPVSETETYPPDTTAYNWLDDPWEDNEEQWINVQGPYTVSMLDGGLIGVQLQHVSQFRSSGISIVVLPAGGGSSFIQSPQAQRPSAGQFRPDWQKFTGKVGFNAAQLGDDVIVKYVSSGTVVTKESRYNLPADVSISGDLDIGWGGPAVPVFGYYIDKTKVYKKKLTGTIAAGFPSTSISHGFSDTGKIESINAIVRKPSNSVGSIMSATPQVDTAAQITFNNTAITVEIGGNANENLPVAVTVEYVQ